MNIRRQTVSEISSDVNSTERERAPLWGVTTIDVAEIPKASAFEKTSVIQGLPPLEI